MKHLIAVALLTGCTKIETPAEGADKPWVMVGSDLYRLVDTDLGVACYFKASRDGISCVKIDVRER